MWYTPVKLSVRRWNEGSQSPPNNSLADCSAFAAMERYLLHAWDGQQEMNSCQQILCVEFPCQILHKSSGPTLQWILSIRCIIALFQITHSEVNFRMYTSHDATHRTTFWKSLHSQVFLSAATVIRNRNAWNIPYARVLRKRIVSIFYSDSFIVSILRPTKSEHNTRVRSAFAQPVV